MIVAAADMLRSKLLKATLRFRPLNELFYHRSDRVLFLFSLAVAIYFFASLFLPLWVLLIGPIIWGVPHLISSLRYSTISQNPRERGLIMRYQLAVWAVVFVYRYCNDVLHMQLFWSERTLLFESVCLIVSFLVQTMILRQYGFKSILQFAVFTGLVAATYFRPIETALVALIGHNYQPLYNWYRSCRHDADRRIFWIASTVFIAASAAIYFGTFNFLYRHLAPNGSIDFLNWDYSEIIAPFVSEDYDYQFWYRIVSLYAFSQAIHYFIWLKAIPENYQTHEHPPSFRTSFRLLNSEFGNGSVILLIALMLVGLSGWLIYEFHVARLVYFALASYHGFMELSSLPFIGQNRKSSP